MHSEILILIPVLVCVLPAAVACVLAALVGLALGVGQNRRPLRSFVVLGWIMVTAGTGYRLVDWLYLVEGIRPVIHSAAIVIGLGLAVAGGYGRR